MGSIGRVVTDLDMSYNIGMSVDWAKVGASIYAQHREGESLWDALRKANAGVVLSSERAIAELQQLMIEDPTQVPMAMAFLREAIETRDAAESAAHEELPHNIYTHPVQQ